MKFIKSFSLVLILIITSTSLFAQRGKDGAKIVAGTEIVNAFTTLTNNANAGSTSITVANSSLLTNFSSPLSQGDLILIYQVQGASVEDSVDNINVANSSRFFPSWGRITNYNNTGNYEFLQVSSVPNATTINFDCALTKNYTAADKVIIVRVPRYSSLTVNNGGVLTTLPWNGSIGGVLAVEVLGITTINVGGVIDVSGLGFRGGTAYTTSVTTVYGGLRYADANLIALEGAEKGEGIAGDQTTYATFNMGGAGYCRGAAANAGGGGNGHNSGGGGGANAGDIFNWNNGVGTPNTSNANYITAWNLETTLSSSTVSSGGGRGGYSILKNNRNELTTPPNDPLWGGDFRRDNGGLGGRPLDYSTGKIFFGGGGGAGEGDNGQATNGGNGGGLIFLSTYGNIIGGGKIRANGRNGIDVNPGSAPVGQLRGIDAAGGAGAGGTIILKTTGTVSLTDSIVANGGRGGNQVLVAGLFASIDEGEGPGGGGGGGYIAISAGTPPLRVANGGINGVTNCPYVSLFPPNGATMGGTGLANETISSFDIVVTGDSICVNTTASISASLSGNPPVGVSIEWFDAQFNGNLVFTGGNFTTPILTTSTTYWVRVCPAPYLVPVLVTVVPCTFPIANFSSSDSSICINDCISFTDLSSGSPTNWSWYFFGSSTPTSSQQNPTNICYPNAGSFDVALVINNTNGQDSIFIANFITVNPLPTVVASNDTSICLGSSATISASGALTYTWNNGLGAGQNHAVSPITTTTYIVTGTDVNGCQNTDNVVVTINPLPTVVASNDTSICLGSSATISASGALTYTWNNGLGAGQNQSPSPITTTTYIVTGTDVNGCQNTDNVVVTINPLPTVVASNDTSICLGSSATISASGALTYTWNNGLGAGQNQSPSPITTTTYIVTGTDVNGCQNTDNVVVTVINCGNSPIANFSASDSSICINDCISFTDLSSGSPTNWLWYFFGSSTPTSSQQNPTNICYPTSGSFDVALVVSNSNGQDSLFLSNFITVNPLPTVVANTNNSSICLGDSIILTGSGATTYAWDNGVTNGISFIPTATTLYTVTGTDLNGCQNTNNVTVTVNSCATPTTNFNSSNNTPCIGSCITFNDLSSENPTNWLWVFNGGTPNTSTNQNPIICYDTIGSYDVQLIVGNSFGIDTLLMTNYITVDSCVQKDPVFIIPNIFSPNNDGNNDVFFVESFGLETLSMKIYNRWGEKLFESNQLDAAWDGRTTSGEESVEGTYFYIITISSANKKKTFKGTITLLR